MENPMVQPGTSPNSVVEPVPAAAANAVDKVDARVAENKSIKSTKSRPAQQQPSEGRKDVDSQQRKNSLPLSQRTPNAFVGHTYRIGRRIGSGNFGVVRVGTNLHSGDMVAIKLEKTTAQVPQLRREYDVYKHLHTGDGIPVVYTLTFVQRYCALVMELLGPNLAELLHSCGGRFSVRTVAMIAKQLIRRMQFIHSKGYVYRDVKPENFTVGFRKDRRQTIYVVDFGLAKRYLDSETRTHIPYRENKQVTGTARFISINMHEGKEMSRRDDLEALGYLFVFLARGHLPWQSSQGRRPATEGQLLNHIYEMKLHTPLLELCQGLPGEFEFYLTYCRNLDFYALPNYDRLFGLFHSLMRNNGWPCDWSYDWSERKLLRETPSGLVVAAARTRRGSRASEGRRNSLSANAADTSGRAQESHEDRTRRSDLDEPSLNGAVFGVTGRAPNISNHFLHVRCPFCVCHCCCIHNKVHPLQAA